MPLRLSYWLLVLSIGLLPWYVVRFSLAGIPTTLLELSLMATGAAWFLEEVWLLYKRKTWPRPLVQGLRYPWLWVAAVALFIAAATLAVVIAPNLKAALGIYKAYMIEPLLVGLMVLRLVRTRSSWWGVMGALGFAMLQIAIMTFTQQLWGWPDFAPAELIQGRSSGVYNTANAVGLFAGPITLASGAIAIWVATQGSKLFSLWWGALFVLGCTSIYLSQSQGALIALAVGCVVLVVWAALYVMPRFKSRVVHAIPFLAILVLGIYTAGVVGYAWWFNHPPQVANPYTRPGFTTLTVRQCTWEGTKLALQDSPILGFGLAGFTSAYLKHATCDAEPLVYPHNFVFNFWSELGLAGLLAVLGVSWLWVTSLQVLLSREDSGSWLGIALALPLIYWLVHGLVDVPYFKNDLAVEWWLLIALALVAGRLWQKGHGSEATPRLD